MGAGAMWRRAALGLFGAAAMVQAAMAQSPAWQPRQTIQLVVPASRGGGADQMARLIRDIAAKHGLAGQPIQVVNKPGHGGFTELKAARGDAHTLLLSLSNVFTAPLTGRADFTWQDFTPVALVALDEFVLWVDADAPYRTVDEFLRAARANPGRRLRMGGTGVGQEDQLITRAIERAAGVEFEYVPHRGGAEVASALVAKRVDATVNNPVEALPGWRAGSLRPLCVFTAERLVSGERPTVAQGWGDIPTCREAGLDVQYEMMRTAFMAPGVEPAQVAYYAELLRRVRETPEWGEFMRAGVFNPVTATGEELRRRLSREEERHRAIVHGGGLSIQTLHEVAPVGLTSAASGQEN